MISLAENWSVLCHICFVVPVDLTIGALIKVGILKRYPSQRIGVFCATCFVVPVDLTIVTLSKIGILKLYPSQKFGALWATHVLWMQWI